MIKAEPRLRFFLFIRYAFGILFFFTQQKDMLSESLPQSRIIRRRYFFCEFYLHKYPPDHPDLRIYHGYLQYDFSLKLVTAVSTVYLFHIVLLVYHSQPFFHGEKAATSFCFCFSAERIFPNTS